MTDAFYEQIDEARFAATEHTRGPWDADHQHAGPPAALLGGALQRLLDGLVVRLTFELLRPVPITQLEVSTTLLRGGRRVALAEGSLADDQGPVLLARAWRITATPVPLPEELDVRRTPSTLPEDAAERAFFPVPWDVGYHTAMETRFVHGAFNEPGPAFAWFRQRVATVAGRAPTPLERVLVVADSANGISARLRPTQWLFVNTDLTVQLTREPAGEWIGLDADSGFERHGVGATRSTILDRTGPLGVGIQSLLLAEQS